MKKITIIILIGLLILIMGWWFMGDQLAEPSDSQERLVFIRDIYTQAGRDFMSIDDITQLINGKDNNDTLITAGLEFLPVANRVKVLIVDRQEFSDKPISISWSFFKQEFQVVNSPLLNSPFLITIANQEVIAISEIIIP